MLLMVGQLAYTSSLIAKGVNTISKELPAKMNTVITAARGIDIALLIFSLTVNEWYGSWLMLGLLVGLHFLNIYLKCLIHKEVVPLLPNN